MKKAAPPTSKKIIVGIPVPKNEIEKNRKVSTTEPIIDEANGAINHFFFLNLSKICTSNNCATMNAVPEPIAIRIEIKSPKFVEKINVNKIPTIKQKLQTLMDVGLDYIKIGQSATTLSGGEAQRIKLSKELSKRSTGKTLYILDEPTTGLHFDDVKKLLKILHTLVDEGNTVLGETEESVVISGQDHLFDLTELSENASKLRNLYKLLAQKTQIINLLQSICSNSKGVRVFIGGESALMPEDCLSVVASPCIVNGKVVGSLGVIGPTRMEFQRVVSLVDVTAKLVSLSIAQQENFIENST